MITGIIPAAGKANRWNGYYKELLPVGNGITLLDRCIQSMQDRADQIVIVSNEEKFGAHAQYLNKKYPEVVLTMQKEFFDIMGAIKAVLPFCGDYTLFAMPDTYFPINTFNLYTLEHDLELGLFNTYEGHRFGVYKDGIIQNKEEINQGKKRQAWGTFAFSRKLADYWMLDGTRDYTRAINIAFVHSDTFSHALVEMGYYYDMENFDAYLKFLRDRQGVRWE